MGVGGLGGKTGGGADMSVLKTHQQNLRNKNNPLRMFDEIVRTVTIKLSQESSAGLS